MRRALFLAGVTFSAVLLGAASSGGDEEAPGTGGALAAGYEDA